MSHLLHLTLHVILVSHSMFIDSDKVGLNLLKVLLLSIIQNVHCLLHIIQLMIHALSQFLHH